MQFIIMEEYIEIPLHHPSMAHEKNCGTWGFREGRLELQVA